MAVTFYFANSVEEAMLLTEVEDAVHFEDELHVFLCKNAERTGPDSNFLISLNPYGTTYILSSEQIKLVLIGCELIKNEYNLKDVQSFADELINLCKRALGNGKLIIALGD